MDQKLSKASFNQLVEQAYPTYLLNLNKTCFTRCVKIAPPHQQQEMQSPTAAASQIVN